MANYPSSSRAATSRLSSALAGAVVVSYALSGWADPGTKARPTPGEQARAVTQRLIDHVRRKELVDVMKLVDVPWGEDGRRVVQRRDALEAFFRKTLREENLADVEWKVGQTVSLTDYRKEAPPKERKVLEKVLTDADRVVRVVADGEHVVLYVRLREGEAQVVGYAYRL